MKPSLPRLVLDTNVVLDWFVFRNPACEALAAAVEAGSVHWIATEAMRAELAHVIGRGVVAAWAPDESALWQSWERLARTVGEPSLTGPATRLRCSDPDDQKFVDLALGGARWLVTRDRAVLKLARRALPLGLQVLPPEHWASTFTESPAT